MRLILGLILALVLASAGAASAARITTNVGPHHPHGGAGLAPDLALPCDCTCRPGDINENEPDCYDGYYDYTNGGCNSTGWTDLSPQGTDCVSYACGASGTYYYGYYSYRDTDWYLAVTKDAGATSETVTAQFAPMVILIYADSGVISCSNYTYVYVFGTACVASTATAYIPTGDSEFWPWVGTQVFGYGVPCGSRYTLDVGNTGPCGITATRPATWGAVKSLYR